MTEHNTTLLLSGKSQVRQQSDRTIRVSYQQISVTVTHSLEKDFRCETSTIPTHVNQIATPKADTIKPALKEGGSKRNKTLKGPDAGIAMARQAPNAFSTATVSTFPFCSRTADQPG
tara:strand:- start:151 stop:501 length:351 start_codon:yes stop_codon:yes gene_type:complete